MSGFAEPTNWNIAPRHPHKERWHHKPFLRLPEAPEEAPEAAEIPIPPAIARRTPQELLIKSFVLGLGVLMIWGIHEPAQLERLAQYIKEERGE